MRLSQSDLKSMLEYHPDGYFVWKIGGKGRSKGSRAGSSKGKEYEQICLNRTLYSTHRLVFLWHHGRFPMQTDHINRDRYDNRIENLREVTEQQNKMNRRGSSDHKNVYPRGVGKWQVAVGLNGKKHYGGTYADLKEAKEKAEQLRNKLHGEYSCNSI